MRKAVAPPLAGWRTRASHGSPSSPSARSALRPTAIDGARPRRSISSPSTSAPARSSPTEGVRFESGSPGRCGCAGTTFQSTVSCLEAERRERAMDDRPGLLCPALRPQARRLVRRTPGEQRPLGGERDAGEAPAGVAHRLADEQERRAARPRLEVGRGVGAAQIAGASLHSSAGSAARNIAERRAEGALRDALDEGCRTAPAQAGAPALSTARTCSAMRSRTACASPLAQAARSGRAAPFTIVLEEDLAILVGRQRVARPAADVVEHLGELRVWLAVGLGDLAAQALGERRARAARRDCDRDRASCARWRA